MLSGLQYILEYRVGWLDRKKNSTFSIFSFSFFTRYLILYTRYYIELIDNYLYYKLQFKWNLSKWEIIKNIEGKLNTDAMSNM